RLVFALSLALGVVGREEVAELELDDELPPEEVRERLARQAPPGLEILSVARIDPRAKAHVRRVTYRAPLSAPADAQLAGRAVGVLAAAELPVERTRPQPR